ncbi:MBL fold metallo-hydrolase [Idiomarina sp.]|uniref:MBL fold metallo-hydrolase RNA specificity domain-containing protein n=1 Tax=Idiomarina sp. TaxID=1874361 RepID=UPI0025835C71|nr:MBL fold metallo-hydrolase [Idiomarina sp.]
MNELSIEWPIRLTHLGGTWQVTGSCHLWHLNARQTVMIDCGAFQGSAQEDDLTPYVDVDSLAAVFITHAHLDHAGRLPQLLALGYRGPIYCTAATLALMQLVLGDSLQLAGIRDESALTAFNTLLARHVVLCEYGQTVDVLPSLSVTFEEAGHILGSSYLCFDIKSLHKRVVFSGDLGCRNSPLINDPTPLERADLLVLESTYGDRSHGDRSQRTQQLESIIKRAVVDGGAILIPAFSIGRTQELLYEFEQIWHQHACSKDTDFPEIVIDSPMANKVTDIYQHHEALWDATSRSRQAHGRHPLDFSHAHPVDEHSLHLALVNRLKSTAEPVIVIAGSGMCTGGRIINYLDALIEDPRTDILFVGYQAQGTLGEQIQRAAAGDVVTINQQKRKVNAQVYSLTGYSAHADQDELLAFIGNAEFPVQAVRLVHGSAPAQHTLAEKIRQQFSIPVTITVATEKP